MEVSLQSNYPAIAQPLEQRLASHKVEQVALHCLSSLSSFFYKAGFVSAGFTACLYTSLKVLGKEPRTSPWVTVVLITISFLGLKGMQMAEARLKTLKGDFEMLFYQQAGLAESPADTLAIFEKYGHYLTHLELTRGMFVAVSQLKVGGSENVFFDLDYDDELDETEEQNVGALVEKQNAARTWRIRWNYFDLVKIFDACPHLQSANVEYDWINTDDLNALWTRQKPGFQLRFV